MVYHLLILDAGIKRYELYKIGTKSDFKLLFDFRFNQKLTRG
jgi:hypothetical protein